MKFTIEQTNDFVHVEFEKPARMISSAILNGGFRLSDHFLNLKVDANFLGEKSDFEAPRVSLQKIADLNNWQGTCVGMMTAAFMSSFRKVRLEEQGVWVEVLVTAGVSNARRAGDKADYRFVNEACEKIGTINILLITNASLSDACMVECVMMITEAKAACLQDLNIKSPVSEMLATGTGTDSTAVASGAGTKVMYCGKHVLFGELIAKATYQAVLESLSVDM